MTRFGPNTVRFGPALGLAMLVTGGLLVPAQGTAQSLDDVLAATEHARGAQAEPPAAAPASKPEPRPAPAPMAAPPAGTEPAPDFNTLTAIDYSVFEGIGTGNAYDAKLERALALLAYLEAQLQAAPKTPLSMPGASPYRFE